MSSDPALNISLGGNILQLPPNSYEAAYFQLTAARAAEESRRQPFDIIIIGSGIGGGVLAASLLEKNHSLTRSGYHSESTPHMPMPDSRMPERAGDPQPLRILVVERGGLIFHTHCLNGSRPSTSGITSQGNDLFFNTFKHKFDIVDKTQEKWAGGPVYCVGGRSAVWGLFTPRISIDTLQSKFPSEVSEALLNEYYGKAEEMLKAASPTLTLPPHLALIDRLNLRTSPNLPFAQWTWGRAASEYRDPHNYNFAEGAYSTIDTLLEAAMNDPKGKDDKNIHTIPNVSVVRLEPAPQPNKRTKVTHVVIRDGCNHQLKIACNRAVICAGSAESAAILLRSADGNPSKYGGNFTKDFGHITDHRIFSVTTPFFYRNMADRDVIGGMRLQTDIHFDVDNTTALAGIFLDGASFLPPTDARASRLPILTVAYTIPSELATANKIELNGVGDPRITFDWAPDDYLEVKKQILKEFAVDVMNKVATVFNVGFAKATDDGKGYSPIECPVTLDDIELTPHGPGVVAHELGSIPMPNSKNEGGILNSDLEMKYGWTNVSVCDLSVLPYSAAPNPTLTLTALALRLSDKLFADLTYSPMTVYNLTSSDVVVNVSNSRPESRRFGPDYPVTIPSGKNETWKIAQKEVMYIRSDSCTEDFDVQMVYPGINAMIVTSPPPSNVCNTKSSVA